MSHFEPTSDLHQTDTAPGDQRLELSDPDSQLGVVGGQPDWEAAILLQMADQSLGHG